MSWTCDAGLPSCDAGAPFSVDGFGGDGEPEPEPEVQQQAYSGGWYFGYDRELHRRREEAAERAKLEEESKSIDDSVSRDIAALLRRQEAQDAKAKELKRLQDLASSLKATEARLLYGQRVEAALSRAIANGNHSALEALDRELHRSMEEEEFLMIAAQMILEDQ